MLKRWDGQTRIGGLLLCIAEFINVKSELVKNNKNLADIVSETNTSYNVGF
jgi:hypothetical protein